MHEKPSGNQETISADAIRLETQSLVRSAAGLIRPGEGNVKSAIAAAARRLRLPASRVKSLWYGEVRRVPADEYLHIRAKLGLLADTARAAADDMQGHDLAHAIDGLRAEILNLQLKMVNRAG